MNFFLNPKLSTLYTWLLKATQIIHVLNHIPLSYIQLQLIKTTEIAKKTIFQDSKSGKWQVYHYSNSSH